MHFSSGLTGMKDQRGDQNLSQHALLNSISEIAEMRRTYAAVEKSFTDPGPRSIVVSSAVATEGKTLIASGLASVVARQGNKRVLAVDLNWYRPALHSVFGLEQTFGIDKLREGIPITDLVQKSKTDHLDVLVAPIQEQRTMEADLQVNLLAEKIIQQAREAYDFAIIDTSAMYPINRCMLDPAVFSNKADGVVLVILTHVTPRKNVKRALMALETSGANILGVVANQCEKDG
jgi:protein-tyrosine kinase